MNTIKQIDDWFTKAVPEPTEKNFLTQLGVDAEEYAELLASMEGGNKEHDDFLKAFAVQVHLFAERLKSGNIRLHIKDRIEFLDAICDRTVTGVGLANYSKMDVDSALGEVARSNDSKFDENGNPIFNENRKIMKGPNYFKPDLRPYV